MTKITYYPDGDIFGAPTQAIVNPVNCVGVMGAGLAKQFAAQFPTMNKAYREACSSKTLRPGKVFTYPVGVNNQFVINVPTKIHWNDDSTLDLITKSLRALAWEMHNKNITSVAIPKLGCGLGGLNWEDVRDIIEQTFENAPSSLSVIVYGEGPDASTPDYTFACTDSDIDNPDEW